MATLCTTRCKIKKLYVLPTQCIYVFCVDLRTNSDYFLYNIKWLVFITEAECVYCAVRTGPLNIIHLIFFIKSYSDLCIDSYMCWRWWSVLGLHGRVQLKRDGTRWRTGGEVKGKLANGVGGQYSSHYLGTWCIQNYYRWCAQLGCQ